MGEGEEREREGDGGKGGGGGGKLGNRVHPNGDISKVGNSWQWESELDQSNVELTVREKRKNEGNSGLVPRFPTVGGPLSFQPRCTAIVKFLPRGMPLLVCRMFTNHGRMEGNGFLDAATGRRYAMHGRLALELAGRTGGDAVVFGVHGLGSARAGRPVPGDKPSGSADAVKP